MISVFPKPVTNTSKHREVEWSELYDLLMKNPVVLPDNEAETKAKHGDYFVRGLIEGNRDDKHLQSCCLLILDVDKPVGKKPLPTPLQTHRSLKGFQHAAWNTATPGRSRIVFPVLAYDKESTDELTWAAYHFCKQRGLFFSYAGESKTKSQPWFLPQTTDPDKHGAYGQVDGKLFSLDFISDIPRMPSSRSPNNRSEHSGNYSGDRHNPTERFIAELQSGTIHQAAKTYAGWKVKTTDLSIGQIFDELDAIISAVCPDTTKVKRWFDNERRELEAWFTAQDFPAPDEGQGWERHIPIDCPVLSRITPDMMPPVLGNMVFAISANTETPPELALTMGLAACATACQKKYTVETVPGHTEQLSLWSLAVLESGNRKSAVEKAMVAPLRAWEALQAELMEADIAKATSKLASEKQLIKKLRGKLGSKGVDDEETIKTITKKEADLTVVPVAPQVWEQDITPEHLGTVMHENGERTGLFSSEGGIFDIIAGRYSKGVPNLDLFLQSHSGDPVKVKRGSRPPVRLAEPALSIGISPQPSVIKSMMEQPGFRGRGLVARFMYVLPLSPLGRRKVIETPSVNPAVSNVYRDAIYSLLQVYVEKTDVLTLSAEAQKLWLMFSLEVEAELVPGGRFEHMTDWAGKLPGMVARIAGVYLCISGSEKVVSADIMEMAIRLSRVIVEHTMAAFDLMGADAEMTGARKIMDWINRKSLSEFSGRDCFESTKGTFGKVKNMNDAIGVLKEHYIVRDKAAETRVGRPSPQYEVNPTALN